MTLSNQRIAYFNGRYVPEGEVLIPYRDRSFMFGDGCFDMTRTFNGRPFKVREHIERFYRSLAYLRIDIGMSPDQMIEVTGEVVRRNAHLIGEGDDYWVGQRVSRGLNAVGDEGWEDRPTVIVDCRPLPLAKRAHYYRDGIPVVFPSVRRVPPESLSPRVKSHNYLNLVMGDLEVASRDPNAWAVLLDGDGNIAEGLGSNVFLVRRGALYTPREQKVLAGVSRETVIELARGLGIDTHEADLDFYDACTADEAFLTSTSLALCPVSSFNGAPVAGGQVPGPITKRLLDAYSNLVDCDIAGQYLRYLDAGS